VKFSGGSPSHIIQAHTYKFAELLLPDAAYSVSLRKNEEVNGVAAAAGELVHSVVNFTGKEKNVKRVGSI